MAQRPVGKKLAGYWEFPGGKIEPAETPEHALIRELDEELSLRIQIKENFGVFSHVYDWGEIRLFVYLVQALNAPRPSSDVAAVKWLSPHRIDANCLTAADHQPLFHYLKYLSAF